MWCDPTASPSWPIRTCCLTYDVLTQRTDFQHEASVRRANVQTNSKRSSRAKIALQLVEYPQINMTVECKGGKAIEPPKEDPAIMTQSLLTEDESDAKYRCASWVLLQHCAVPLQKCTPGTCHTRCHMDEPPRPLMYCQRWTAETLHLHSTAGFDDNQDDYVACFKLSAPGHQTHASSAIHLSCLLHHMLLSCLRPNI